MEHTDLPAETVALLREKALEARENAYAPYSGFQVGAALLAADGTIYTGVNVENAAFSPTNCAERTAFFTAIAAGRRKFLAVAVAGGAAGETPREFCTPCGVCRQVMREFCTDDFEIILVHGAGTRIVRLGALLPESFSPENLR